MKKIFQVFFLIIISFNLYAVSPVDFTRKKVQIVIDELNKFPDLTNKQSYHIISLHIMPEVDLIEVSKWVAGRNAWKNSTKLQKNQFTDSIANYMSITYGDIMLEFVRAYKVINFEYLPMRSDYTGKKRVLVSSKLIMEDPVNASISNKIVNFDFRLIRHNEGWKFYDMAAEGVSILKGLQELLSDAIKTEGLPKGIQIINNMVLLKKKPNFLGLLKLLDKASNK